MSDHPAPAPPRFGEAVRFWFKIGCISFGGPAGQIAILHTELVERRRWVSEERFLNALNFCMLLPGPEAQQLATWCGWALHGTRGAVAAGALFVLPAAVLLWALSWLALAGGSLPWLAAIFRGLEPAVLALIAAALVRLGRRTLKTSLQGIVAALAFCALSFLQAPFPLVLAGAALGGLVLRRWLPAFPPRPPSTPPTNARRSSSGLGALGTCLALWAGPCGLLAAIFGPSSLFVQQALFFTKAAFVTFGGAYAVLPYVAQQAVESFGWLSPGEMMAGLALAETTPGPLILVLQFVGFAGGWNAPGALTPLAAGTLGAAVTTWFTFLPSFLFILLGAPHLDRLGGNRFLTAALSAVTAAVVGVILNLAVWFGAHALVTVDGEVRWLQVVCSVAWFLALVAGRWSLPAVVAGGGAAGLLIWWAGIPGG